MTYRLSFLALLLLATACAPMAPTLQVAALDSANPQLTKKTAIQRYLQGRDLDPIEGIWNWADGSYQVVITRNNTGIRQEYKYIGVLLESRVPGWRSGQVKLLLNETASKSVFAAVYFNSQQIENTTSFTVSKPGSLESQPVSFYGSQLKVVLNRSYPKVASVADLAATLPGQTEGETMSANTN